MASSAEIQRRLECLRLACGTILSGDPAKVVKAAEAYEAFLVKADGARKNG